MSQTSLWQTNQQNNDFAEICNALYERELRVLANSDSSSVQNIQGRLSSLAYYINRTADLMTQVKSQGISPLTLDIQNASWSAKQAAKLSLSGQTAEEISLWYLTQKISLGLVVPILKNQHIILDSIDRIDIDNKRIRTNTFGWLSLALNNEVNNKQTTCLEHNHASNPKVTLLKPNKKVMLAACAGHCWRTSTNSAKTLPIIPTLRELLLSCAINWKNFKKPLTFTQ